MTLEGPGGGFVKQQIVDGILAGPLRAAFDFLNASSGSALGLKVAAAFVSGVRLHHFYVDSKIWRVSKSAALARNLTV